MGPVTNIDSTPYHGYHLQHLDLVSGHGTVEGERTNLGCASIKIPRI